MVRRASEKKTFLWCFREVILISVYAHSPPHLFILSLSIWRRFFSSTSAQRNLSLATAATSSDRSSMAKWLDKGGVGCLLQTHTHDGVERDAGRIGWDSCTGIVALIFFVRRRGIG